MLEVIDIWKSFGTKEVLRGVSFAIPPGTIAGMIGPSGSGKSVLMKIIGHGARYDRGQVNYGDCEMCDVDLMFQEGALFDSLSVYDNVAFPLVHGDVPTVNLSRARRDEVHPKIEEILSRVGLTKAAWKMPGQISGGMRRRVSLARALVSRPKILLLDDPTSGLDPVASSVIMDLIVELHREYNPTTLMASHDLRRLLPVCDHLFALFEGQIVFSGTLEMLNKSEFAEQPDPELALQVRRFAACRYDFGERDLVHHHV
jgi:phospholipid/cholesterol/gamma-HCH transport system ATP-binding protein